MLCVLLSLRTRQTYPTCSRRLSADQAGLDSNTAYATRNVHSHRRYVRYRMLVSSLPLFFKTPASGLLCAYLFEGNVASLAIEKHAVTTLVTHLTPSIHFATLLLYSNTIVLSLSLALCYCRVLFPFAYDT